MFHYRVDVNGPANPDLCQVEGTGACMEAV